MGEKRKGREGRGGGMLRVEEPVFGFDDGATAKQRKKSRQKFLKLQKKPFCSACPLSFSLIPPFFPLPPLFKHVFANCQTLFCPSQALHSSQVYSAGGGRGGRPNNPPRSGTMEPAGPATKSQP